MRGAWGGEIVKELGEKKAQGKKSKGGASNNGGNRETTCGTAQGSS